MYSVFCEFWFRLEIGCEAGNLGQADFRAILVENKGILIEDDGGFLFAGSNVAFLIIFAAQDELVLLYDESDIIAFAGMEAAEEAGEDVLEVVFEGA
jgi:hypothetical protein